MSVEPGFDSWMADLEARHLANLTFTEVARALRALSSAYVERRETALSAHRALDGAGKRAAFALYYGPLHFLAVSHVLARLAGTPSGSAAGWPVIDVGCGTGAAGAAAAGALGASAVLGLDTHPWALDEARHTYAAFGLEGSVARQAAARLRPPRRPAIIVAAYVANELGDEERERFRRCLLEARRLGSQLLVVEPLARRAAPWWQEWVGVLADGGGRADEWKLTVDAPSLVRRLGESAGLTPGKVNLRTLLA